MHKSLMRATHISGGQLALLDSIVPMIQAAALLKNSIRIDDHVSGGPDIGNIGLQELIYDNAFRTHCQVSAREKIVSRRYADTDDCKIGLNITVIGSKDAK